MSEAFYLYAFRSTHAAIRAQRLLSAVEAILMPTLREISASCGMALRIEPARAEEAAAILTASDLAPEEYARYYAVKEGKGHRVEPA